MFCRCWAVMCVSMAAKSSSLASHGCRPCISRPDLWRCGDTFGWPVAYLHTHTHIYTPDPHFEIALLNHIDSVSTASSHCPLELPSPPDCMSRARAPGQLPHRVGLTVGLRLGCRWKGSSRVAGSKPASGIVVPSRRAASPSHPHRAEAYIMPSAPPLLVDL